MTSRLISVACFSSAPWPLPRPPLSAGFWPLPDRRYPWCFEDGTRRRPRLNPSFSLHFSRLLKHAHPSAPNIFPRFLGAPSSQSVCVGAQHAGLWQHARHTRARARQGCCLNSFLNLSQHHNIWFTQTCMSCRVNIHKREEINNKTENYHFSSALSKWLSISYLWLLTNYSLLRIVEDISGMLWFS